jgi:hypothetical protein
MITTGVDAHKSLHAAVAFSFALCWLALLWISCSVHTTDSDVATPTETIIILQANGKLRAADLESGRILYETALVSNASTWPTRTLLASRDRDSIYALVSGQVFVLNSQDGSIFRTFALDDGSVYRSMTIGPLTGDIYLVGNRGNAVVLTVLDSNSGSLKHERFIRTSDHLDWLIYEAAVSPDEQFFFVSYHGTNTQGP